jgi:ubiquitin C-terminal hydrolase
LHSMGDSDTKNLENLVRDFFDAEQIPDFKCSSCKKAGGVFKKSSIWTYPKNLFLSVSRFKVWPRVMKKKDKVKIPSTKINLTEYKQKVVSEANLYPYRDMFRGRPSSFGAYNIVGYVEHWGEINSGHYIAYCASKGDGNKWTQFDDDKTKKILDIGMERPFAGGSGEVYIIALELATK